MGGKVEQAAIWPWARSFPRHGFMFIMLQQRCHRPRCGHVKLADFGSCARLSEGGSAAPAAATPDYVAPELLAAADCAARHTVCLDCCRSQVTAAAPIVRLASACAPPYGIHTRPFGGTPSFFFWAPADFDRLTFPLFNWFNLVEDFMSTKGSLIRCFTGDFATFQR